MDQRVATAQRGELAEFFATPERIQRAEAHRHGQEVLAQVERDPTLTEVQRRAVRDEIQRRLVFCRENWVLIDLHRRLHLRVDADVAAPPPPQTRLEKPTQDVSKAEQDSIKPFVENDPELALFMKEWQFPQ